MIGWPAAQPLNTADLLLEPLRVEHAEEMAPVLDDQSLRAYQASMAVAAAIGMRPTETVVEGEVLWTSSGS